MTQRMKHGRLGLALGLALASVASAVIASPASAQSSRFGVLVAPISGRQGSKIADEVRKQIDEMPTHVSVPNKEVKSALKKFGVKEEAANCITYRQLMSNPDAGLNAKLVMCGEIDANGQMVAQFFNPDGSSYDVPPFQVTSESAAAQQVATGFQNYVRMLQVVTYCDDYLRSSQWQEALDNCNQAIELNPKSTHAIYGRGSALMNMERMDEALAAFEQVVQLDPINQEALLAAAVVASKLGQEEVSRRHLNEYLALNPGDIQVRLNIATKIAQEGDPIAAVALIEEVEHEDTTNLVLREYAGHFAMNAAAKLSNSGPANGNADAAAPYFEKALAHYKYVHQMKGDTTPPQVVRNIMVAHGGLGHKQEALEWGRRATAHPEADAQTWSAYADQLRNAERWQESLAALDKVRQLDPTYSVAARRALILMETGQLSDVVAAVREASQKDELPDAQRESIAQRLIKTGYDNFQKAKKYETAVSYYDAARNIASTERTKAMANFFQGFGIYEQARAVQEKGTVATARQSLPMFTRAKTLIEGSGAYTEGATNRANLLNAINQLIEIQNAIIKRG